MDIHKVLEFLSSDQIVASYDIFQAGLGNTDAG